MGRPKSNKTMKDAWIKVNKGDIQSCWEWQGGKFANGYGAFCLDGKTYKAHRVIFYLENEYWPDHVLHMCDNPPCCNPYHLQGGDNSLNQLDSVSKKRHHQSRKTHCPKGHEYDGNNLGFYSNGHRYCKECNRLKHSTPEAKARRKKR